MQSTDAKDTEAFLWCLDIAILSVSHCEDRLENLYGTLGLSNTKTMFKYRAMRNMHCKPYEMQCK